MKYDSRPCLACMAGVPHASLHKEDPVPCVVCKRPARERSNYCQDCWDADIQTGPRRTRYTYTLPDLPAKISAVVYFLVWCLTGGVSGRPFCRFQEKERSGPTALQVPKHPPRGRAPRPPTRPPLPPGGKSYWLGELDKAYGLPVVKELPKPPRGGTGAYPPSGMVTGNRGTR